MKQASSGTRSNMRAVALRAGVSSATVSRVINGSPAVKKDTALRVRRAIQELDFIPNPIATTLKYGRSNTFGVIIPDLANPFYPEFVLDFEQLLIENDQELLLATTQANEPKLIGSVRRMLMRQVDGVVLMASEFDTRSIEPLFNHRIPIVTVDRRRTLTGSGDVGIDFEDGYRQAVLHLRNLGHKRIGFIGGAGEIRTSQIRLEAFQQAIQDAGLTFYPKYIRCGDYRVTGGEVATHSLLTESPRPTAILTANDLTAFGVLRVLHVAGIRVPLEMSVVGFDGIQLSGTMPTALTTISISGHELAQACVKSMEYIRTNPDRRGLLLTVGGTLVVRESTASAPARNRS